MRFITPSELSAFSQEWGKPLHALAGLPLGVAHDIETWLGANAAGLIAGREVEIRLCFGGEAEGQTDPANYRALLVETIASTLGAGSTREQAVYRAQRFLWRVYGAAREALAQYGWSVSDFVIAEDGWGCTMRVSASLEEPR